MFEVSMFKQAKERLKLLTVTDVYTDFTHRRAGIIKALTTDFEEFRVKCDPEANPLCLYGLPSEEWEVKEYSTHPAAIPKPSPCINLVRDTMPAKEWLAEVAVSSDAWLLYVAYNLGSYFDKADRKLLFDMMNELPTVYELVSGDSPKLT